MLQKVLRFFKKDHPPLVALDISATSVKLLEFSKKNAQICIENFAVVPLEPEAVVDKFIKKPELVVEAIKAAIKKAGTATSYAAVALPDSSVITKWITLDGHMHDNEIEAQIMSEVDKYVPYAVDEVRWDFVIKREKGDKGKFVDMLLVASRRENIDALVEVIGQAGLELKIVDIQSCVIERTFPLVIEQIKDYSPEKLIAIVDIGSIMMNLTVLQDMHAIFAREEVFGGEQLTQEIQRRYGLSYAEAGLAKKTGKLPADYEVEVLNPFKESAVLQVRRALQFFYSATDHNHIDYILLAGGTAAIPGLAAQIENQLGLPTTLMNPFSSMAISSNIWLSNFNKDIPALIVCCGLALRGLP